MELDEAGKNFIKEKEALRLHAYYDERGTPTIGWGHTEGVKIGDVITREQAEAFFEEDTKPREAILSALLLPPVTQGQFNAMVSLSFNIGLAGFEGSSVLREFNAKMYQKAADSFLSWNKEHKDGKLVFSQGLYNRRQEERAMFLKDTP